MTEVNDLFRRLVGCYGVSLIFHALLGIVVAFYSIVPLPEPIAQAETIFIDTAISGLPGGGGETQSAQAKHATDSAIASPPLEDPAKESPAPNAAVLPAPAEKFEEPKPEPKQEIAPVVVKEKAIPLPPAAANKAEHKPGPKPKVVATKTPAKPAAKTSPKVAEKNTSLPPKAETPVAATAPAPIEINTSDLDAPLIADEDANQVDHKVVDVVAAKEDIDEAAATPTHYEQIQDEMTATPVVEEPNTNAPSPHEQQQAQLPTKHPSPPAQEAAQSGSSTSSSSTSTSGPSTVHGLREASELAEAAGNRPPQYPERDRLMRNQGTVVLIAYVNNDGTVSQVQFEQNAPSKTLDTSALSAMKRWRFMPGQAGWVRKGFTFSLGGTTEELPARLRR